MPRGADPAPASLKEATLSIRFVWPFTRLLAAYPNTELSLARAGVHALDFANPDTRIPHRAAVALLEEAIAVTGDPACGLRAGEQIEPGDFHVLEYAARAAPNLGEAVRVLARYFRLMHDAIEISLKEVGENVAWCHRTTDAVHLPPAVNDFAVAASVTFVRRNVCHVEPPVEVWFTHAQPSYVAEYERIFQAPIRFGAPWNAVVLKPGRLSAPMLQANPRVSHAFELHAQTLLERLQRSDGTAGRVREAVLKELGSGEVSMSRVAQTLAMSVATLRRRLEAEGTTFSDLVDDVRKKLAHQYLSESSPSVSEVAFLLGFSNVTAFHRAFRRWHGMPPTEYRARNLGRA